MSTPKRLAASAWVLILGTPCLAQLADSEGRQPAPTAPGEIAAARDFVLESGTRVRLAPDGSYSVLCPDGRRSGWRVADREIRLANRVFDPLAPTKALPALPILGQLRLIQMATQPLEEYMQAMAALGIEVLRFIPGQTLLARVPKAADRALEALPFVRWVGGFLLQDRLEANLLQAFESGTLVGEADYLIQLMRRGSQDATPVKAVVLALGGRAEEPSPRGFLLRASMSPQALLQVASMDQVLWIEHDSPPALASWAPPIDNVRSDSGLDILELLAGYTGLGVRGEVFDEGLDFDHPDFAHHRPLAHGPNVNQKSHGTGTHGVIFGDGATLPQARGLLPEGQSIFASFRRLTDRYQHTEELLEPPFEAVLQTNSWGNGPSAPGYPSLSFEMDDLIHTYDLLTCQAFGNAGRSLAFRQAWAKNVVTVGGIRHRNTLSLDDDAWAGGASAGPATDGRIKPDLCYWNDRILSTKPTAGHREIGGTSASTPCVAGHFGVFYQMWHDESFGNVASGIDVFQSRPHSSTARAFLFNSALAYPFSAAGDDLERTTQGWGRPNAARLHEMRSNALVVDEWRALRNLEVASYQVHVEQGQDRLHATLVYTDLPGNSAALEHRVNDLSLCLTSPSGLVYWGNNGLLSGNLSTPGGTSNTRDTVEQVWLKQPEPGFWQVDVVASEVVLDAQPATPELDASFALVVAPIRPIVGSLAHGMPSGAASGSGAAPLLEARGSFVPGAPFRFDLSNAVAHSEVFLLLGASLQPGESVGPHHERINDLRAVVIMRVDASGRASYSGTYSLPNREHPFYVQAIARHARTPSGLAASNVLAILGSQLR